MTDPRPPRRWHTGRLGALLLLVLAVAAACVMDRVNQATPPSHSYSDTRDGTR